MGYTKHTVCTYLLTHAIDCTNPIHREQYYTYGDACFRLVYKKHADTTKILAETYT